jgi:hypothetical protein
MRWLGRLIHPKKQQTKTNNNQQQILKPMARKTVISKVLDVDAQDGIIEFPQNRTLYADQFTDEAPTSDADREGFKPKNMKEVFEHYQPNKKGVALTTEEGGAAFEDFDFKSIRDFEDEQLIEQSELLSAEKGKIDAYNSVIRQLEKNKTLRNTLKDAAARGDLKNALEALLAELNAAEK